MPQHQLIKTKPEQTGVTIVISEPTDPTKTGFVVEVKCTWDNGVTASCWHQTYEGVMVDLVTDLALEAASAFLYGQSGDVQRACRTNWRVARAHWKKHQYSEPF